MAHEIENMMYVGATPWHGLGRKVEGAVSVDDALRLAGLDWTVGLEDLVVASDTAKCDSLDECRVVPARAVVRSSDGRILGVVGNDYEPVQNSEKLAIIAPLVESGAAKLETAGSLRGGRKVWLQATLGNVGEVTRGDVVRQHILVAGSHDGTMAVRVTESMERVVCANTLQVALAEGGRGVSIKHTRSAHDRMAEVARVVQTAQRHFASALESYKFLAAKSLTAAEIKAYAKQIFAQPKSAPSPSAIVVVDASGAPVDPAGERVAERIMDLVESGRGSNLPGVRGTAWGAYNAVTEYLTHERGNNADTRLDSNWFGNGAMLNRKALDLAMALGR